MGTMGCGNTKAQHRVHDGKFRPIPDRFTTIEQVQVAVRAAGLESSNLILGVNFTKSNKWTGKLSYGGRCLHDVSGTPNPYEQAISVVGRTLEEFDDDRLIPAFGFGDSTTGDSSCFPFHEDGRPSVGVEETLSRYKEVAETVNLAGPTSFAPVIREAINIVREEQSYHILVIIADGQVTDHSPTGETARAIIEASQYPISIVVVGVGDGPWDVMESYDDELPSRRFDNFQFVDFNKVRHRKRREETQDSIEAKFALHCLMEVPDQYALIKYLGLLDAHNFPRSYTVPQPLAPSPLAPQLASSAAMTIVPPPINPVTFHPVAKAVLNVAPPNYTAAPPNYTHELSYG